MASKIVWAHRDTLTGEYYYGTGVAIGDFSLAHFYENESGAKNQIGHRKSLYKYHYEDMKTIRPGLKKEYPDLYKQTMVEGKEAEKRLEDPKAYIEVVMIEIPEPLK